MRCGADLFPSFFFFNDTATTEIYTLSLHDALPICDEHDKRGCPSSRRPQPTSTSRRPPAGSAPEGLLDGCGRPRQLVRNAAVIPASPPLLYDFAEAEIARMSEFLKELGEGSDVTYDGEDRDWLLGLARHARSTIDATSFSTVDAGSNGFDGGFWVSDLGQRYLEVQRDAAQRGVAIRRIFILDRPELKDDPAFLGVYRLQVAMNIQVRFLDASTMPERLKIAPLFDFILFDDVLSYEAVPAPRVSSAANPNIRNTELVLRRRRVDERIERYKNLWSHAQAFE